MASHDRLRRYLVLAALAASAACAACAGVPVNRPGPDAPAGPADPEELLSERLFFGRLIPGGGAVSDSSWAAFLAEVVTPRFPSGLTVWRAEGQWLDPRAELVREPVMVVEVLHPRGAPADSVFGHIAAEYMVRFSQDAVLRTTSKTRTRLYTATPR